MCSDDIDDEHMAWVDEQEEADTQFLGRMILYESLALVFALAVIGALMVIQGGKP